MLFFICSDSGMTGADVRVGNYRYLLNQQTLNTKIKIGELDCNSLLYLDAPDVANYMYNLIEYALLREEVRTDSRN